MKLSAPLSVLLLLSALFVAACGGGGGANPGIQQPKTAAPAVVVHWPARTRDVSAPSSALSLKIVLHSTNPQQADIEIDGSRNSTLTAHSETYTFNGQVLIGNYTLTATFYSAPSLGGVVTATASAQVSVQTTGNVLGTVDFTSAVKSVTIAANQSVVVGNHAQVVATAYAADGSILALTPGSFAFAIASGGANASITPDGVITGVGQGAASVTASVDGLSSAAAPVQVLPVKSTPSISVDWPLRTRNVIAPSSALSVKVILHDATGANPDVEIDGNRSSSLSPHTDTFSYPGQAAVGPYALTATFYSQPSQAGIVTATASASVAVSTAGAVTNPDGTPLGPISFTGLVKSVAIQTGQTVTVGGSTQLLVSATDASNNVMALSPGSFSFTVVSGGSYATVTPDGVITGVALGTPTLTVSVDGLTSAATGVPVIAQPDFANPGFENPQIASGTFDFAPANIMWGGTIPHSWGYANGSGSWGTGAHSGTQYAFIQGNASMSQTITGLNVGKNYQVTFWVAARHGDVGADVPCPMWVTANGATIYGPFTPPSDFNWYQYTTSTFTATSNSYTFVFDTTWPGQDASDLLDDVHLVQVN